jgi:hypothetical protein
LRELALLLASWGVFGRGDTVDFDSLKPGTTPADWTSAVTHRGEPGRWVVHPDASAPSRPNVLAQLSPDSNRFRFALALYDKGYCRNGDLTVNLKVISGKADQTAGLVWRYQDRDNYYLLHVSANEDTIRIFRVADGKAVPIARLAPGLKPFQVSHHIDPLEWYLLRVSFRDAHITVFFDHRKVMEADDSSIAKPGKTGVWTKGDTVAYFDDFRIDKKKE